MLPLLQSDEQFVAMLRQRKSGKRESNTRKKNLRDDRLREPNNK
jgi:hypothetical protein